MSDSCSLFCDDPEKLLSGVSYKSYILKRRILSSLSDSGLLTVSDLASQMGISTPTAMKLISELIGDGYLQEMGKMETQGGRRPCSYALVGQAGYFLGVEVGEDCLRFAMVDLSRNIVGTSFVDQFDPVNVPDTIGRIIKHIELAIESFDVPRDKLLGVGLILRGRVDSVIGHSYNYLHFSDKHLSDVLSEKLNLRVIIENDTRAIAYAEHVENSESQNVRNSLFINVGRGVGVGIIINGELYYGKSGFAGEFGHIPFFQNQIICHCGKKGCLETEVSGTALENTFMDSLRGGASSILSQKFLTQGHVSLADIVQAASMDDVLSIELIGDVGEKLGRSIGVLVNLLNPEAVIIGGAMSKAGDYLMLPLRSALAKYSLSLVNNDSVLRVSTVGDMGSVIGGALLTRNHILSM